MYTSNPDLSQPPTVALTDFKEMTPEIYLRNIKIQILLRLDGLGS